MELCTGNNWKARSEAGRETLANRERALFLFPEASQWGFPSPLPLASPSWVQKLNALGCLKQMDRLGTAQRQWVEG